MMMKQLVFSTKRPIIFPMNTSSTIIDVTPRTKGAMATVYFLLALAFFLTGVGVVLGALFAPYLLTTGWMMILLIAEIALILSAPAWMHRSPLNIILFALFPLFSGISLTPFLLSVSYQYVNGATILLNASIATALLSLASGVIASQAKTDLSQSYGWIAFQGLLGLIIFGVLQMFIPSLRGGVVEVMASGIGIVIFSVYTAIDFQRVLRRSGDSPFLLALTVYLDLFNLFLYVVRFMLATSGRRR